ncbi:MAG: serine hydrolase domain-containing protein [Candidatus Promineifilaceae bacterium]
MNVRPFEATFEAWKAFVREWMKVEGVPGAALAVSHQGETAAAGLGITSVENPLPVTSRTLFQIGSITKTLTAMLLLRLVEQGLLALGEPVRAYLPDFQLADEAAAAEATLRHLLTHTGGWEGDFFRDTGSDDFALARYVAEMAGLEQVAPLGMAYSYCNSGFAVAGRIAEVVTGRSYEEALTKQVLGPLGLESCYFTAGDVISRRFAVGHKEDDPGRPAVARPWTLPRAVAPVGGIVSDVESLLAYGRFHLGDGIAAGGERLLSAKSLAAMQTPQVEVSSAPRAVGLPWFIYDLEGSRRLAHGGGTKGQIALLTFVPEHNFCLALLTNSDGGDQVTLRAARWAYDHFLGLTERDPSPLPAGEAQVAEYAGRYTRPYQDLELTPEGGRLRLQTFPKAGFPSQDVPPNPPSEPFYADLYAADRFIVLEGNYRSARGDFVRRPDGSLGWLRFGGRLHRPEG